MPGVKDDALVRQGPWPAGVNNLADEDALPRDANGGITALRVADNIDLDREGHASSRDGATRSYAGVLTHSLWSNSHLSFGLFVDADELRVAYEDGSTEPLGVPVAGGMPVSYARINDRIYWSNHVQCGMVTSSLDALPWAPEQPIGQPALALEQGLQLDPGQWQIAVTFTDALGRESGARRAAVIEVQGENGIRLSRIPQPVDATATPWINVFCTGADGKTLRLHSRIPAGQAELAIGSPARGRALETLLVEPMPPGQIVRHFNGIHLVACGRELLWSPPLHYGMVDPMRNRIRFPKDIDVMEPVGEGTEGAGVYIAAGPRTYFLAGGIPKNFRQQPVYGHGAVRGTGIAVPGDVFGFETTTDVVAWLARSGQFCVGLGGGQVVPLKKQEAAVDSADSGAVLFREANGIRQLLASLKAPRAQGMAIRDRAVGRVIYDES